MPDSTLAPVTDDLANIFGVRHLSPMGAWQLRHYLEKIRPTAVLIEGLSDAGELIDDIVRRDTQPPIAILAYTDSTPVRTLIYPMARYSPEYQALVWAKENSATVDFIDLPSDIFLALQSIRPQASVEAPDETEDAPATKTPETEEPESASVPKTPAVGPENRGSLYEKIASRFGESDYESYWERHFEHNLGEHSYRLAAIEFGHGLRSVDNDHPLWVAENLVREAYMRRRIRETIAAGHDPEKVVVIVGAYHASAMRHDQEPMSDEELSKLKRLPSKLTLMPYSYFKLSSQSGYGAGNHAPAYFDLIWQSLKQGELSDVPTRYLTMVAHLMRDQGTHRSTAEVIEGVRLARTLSAMKDGLAPTLKDLQDAATAILGHGELSAIREFLARVEVGTAIGSLPKGVRQTSIQEDFHRELKRLNLEKYRTSIKQDLSLDLRENRQAKSTSAAFMDLSRSSFLHKLNLLGIGFGAPARVRQDSATWAENWHVQWTPEIEIALVESVLLGETIDLAAGFQFKTRLERAKSIADASDALDIAFKCGMFDSLELARAQLQKLAADSNEFTAVAHAASQLSGVIRYGNVRKFDPTPLMPLIEQLFVQGSLALSAAANCNNDAAQQIAAGMEALNRVSQEFDDLVNESLWIEQLQRLSDVDDKNPLLSGYACSILLERTLISNEQLAREVSRRLSPGTPADLGAGWFEGMSKRNRYALLARQVLWEQLADYVTLLDDEQFKRALVFLRRAFGNFSPPEKRSIAENLGNYWGAGADPISELLHQPMTEQEQASLEELNDFDFGDL